MSRITPVQSGVAALVGSHRDVGKGIAGIADLLVDKLVADGTYSVIGRKALDKILAGQNVSNSDRADPSSAARIARLPGVDAIMNLGREIRDPATGKEFIGQPASPAKVGDAVSTAT